MFPNPFDLYILYHIAEIACETYAFFPVKCSSLTCLKAYILADGNISAAAAKMYVHRHTAIYRIEKIEQLLGVKLAELDEKELGLMWITCELIHPELFMKQSFC